MKKKILIAFIIMIVIFLIYQVYNNQAHKNTQKNNYTKSYQGMMMLNNGNIITDASSIINENNHIYINIESIKDSLPKDCNIMAGKLMIKPHKLDMERMDDAMRNITMFSDTELILPLAQRPSGQFIDVDTLAYIAPLIIQIDESIQLYSEKTNVLTSYLNRQTDLFADSAMQVNVGTLYMGEKVNVIETGKTNYKIITQEARVGYIAPDSLSELTPIEQVRFPKVGASRRTYGKLQMTFNHMTNYDALIAQNFTEKINGLDIIMPTTLTINIDGSLNNIMDMHYVKMLKSLGYSVHVVVNNQFNPDMTSALLNDEASVNRFVDQIELYVRFFGLDGVSIDFENVYFKDQVAFTNLVNKVNQKTLALGIPLSVCATRPNGSDNWSRFMDRSAVSAVSDYIIFMAYDEHWASSQTAGSVASIGWTVSGIEAMINEVPADKLILGIPTYMRAYTKAKVGDKKLTSIAVSMKKFEDYIKNYEVFTEFDTEAEQNYYELKDSKGAITKIWREDRSSVTKRLDLVKQYDLAGIASWRYGFESEGFWKITQSKLK